MAIFNKIHLSPSIFAAIGAAVFFGASTPIIKLFIGTTSPILIAGLLYLGSGVGLMLIKIIRDKGWQLATLEIKDWLWLSGAITCGGILAPILLMYGLTYTSSADASLLLNLEAVLTSTIAWVIFKENADKRIILGMILIVVGGILLSLQQGKLAFNNLLGIGLIAGACLCWAIDNNLTRKVANSDVFFIAGSKGLFAGIVNICLACSIGAKFPQFDLVAIMLVCGFVGYGLSLLLFILALRGLGTSRTGAYFSIAPFIGVVISILIFHDQPSLMFWLATVFMACGVWLHLTEVHDHIHTHIEETHEHLHVHDEHHQHEHDFAYDGSIAHSHIHQHDELTHEHHHYPDAHHLHTH